MPDATHGVSVHRYVDGTDPGGLARYLDSSAFDTRMKWNGADAELGTWYPADEAAARDAVIVAACLLSRAQDAVCELGAAGQDAEEAEAHYANAFATLNARLDAIRGAA